MSFKYTFTSLQQTPLEEELWYYGDISRDNAVELVKNDGDCLVRYSRNQERHVVTAQCGGEVKHFIITKMLYQVTINRVLYMYSINLLYMLVALCIHM